MSRNVRSSEIYEKIKEMILSRELLQGDRIPEERIAESLEGSRTPVREAFRLLAAEGLVEISPRHGATVAVYDESAISEIGAVRLSQDILAARLAIQYGSYQDLLDLQQKVAECEDCARKGDIPGFIKADAAFHLAIAALSRNQVLIENQNRLYQIIRLVQASRYLDPEKSLQDVRHHRDILKGLIMRDFKLTCDSICDHLQDYYMIDPLVVSAFRAAGGAAENPLSLLSAK